MKFVDEVTISVEAGDGGAGASHFRREKYVPYGGPDGGDGGNGGSVIARADSNIHTLLDFQYQPHWKAKNGSPGEGQRKDGKDGEDLLIKVPIGTQIINPDTGEVLFDLKEHDATYVIAQGGKGGRGNARFKSATNRAPEYAQPGLPGEEISVTLSLKLVADVGIIGLPNAGKSTLISRLSRAKPRIADYPFTTLTPNLGVVKNKNAPAFVVADIPGLIPGAHEGKGLGIQFLKHVERTGILLHLIDPLHLNDDGSPLHPLEAYQQIEDELCHFDDGMKDKRRIVAFSKSDSLQDDTTVVEAETALKEQNIPCFRISSVSGDGLESLTIFLTDRVQEWRQMHAPERI